MTTNVNEASRQYYDIDGKPISLYKLVRQEPEWAQSRIQQTEDYEKMQSENAALKQRIAELRGEAEALREELAILRDSTNALLHQIDIGDFVDDHGHSAKMLKPVHDLMRILTANDMVSGGGTPSA